MIYILKYKAQHPMVWNNVPPHNSRFSPKSLTEWGIVLLEEFIIAALVKVALVGFEVLTIMAAYSWSTETSTVIIS